MEKISKHKKNIILFCFAFISIFFTIMIKPVTDLDEIWNFNVARAMTEGLIPYKDISLITTPLLPTIASIFLKIFGSEMIVTRILASLIGATIISYVYKIFLGILKEENIALIATGIIGIILKNVYALDYNLLVVLFALIILYKEIKNISKENTTEKLEKKDIKENLIIGIIAGLAFCTKQSTGAILAIVTTIAPILKIQNKQEIKKTIKTSAIRIIGIILPIIMLIIYLLCTNSLTEFISYAVFGISTFTNKIPYKELFADKLQTVRILSRIIPITILTMGIIIVINNIKQTTKRNTETIIILFIYSISTIITMYPIADTVHFLEGSTITIISLLYLICTIGKKIYNKIKLSKKKFLYKSISIIICTIMIAGITIFDVKNISKYTKLEKNTEIKHYKYMEVVDYLEERITILDKFILEAEEKGKKVYILDAEAAIYMIPIDKYNKNYDLFLRGNLGKDGEEGEIEKIKNRDNNTIYLIRKANINQNWQAPENVITYIRDNLELLGQITMYDVYQ